MKKWENYIEQYLIPLVGKHPEGNMYSNHKTICKSDLKKAKQKNIIEFFKKYQPKNVLEIGFNTGYSALLMKMLKSDINLTCIDINKHNYVIPCYQQISKNYENIELITKNSLIALPELIALNKKYDVIHIDGNHRLAGAKIDLEYCLKLSNPGTVIIFDDTDQKHLDDLCTQNIKNNMVKEYIFNKIKGTVYEHRFLEVL